MRILVTEDDIHLARDVVEGLTASGYGVDLAADGEAGLEMARAYSYDLIILDIMLPGIDGFTFCHEIRKSGSKTPILILTARQRTDDRVRGLDAGADDYLVKPFSYPELYARVRALLRRAQGQVNPEIMLGGLHLDTSHKQAYFDGREIGLTAKEYAILEYLVFNRNGIVTIEMLEEHVWDCEHAALSNVIQVLVSRIRHKLDPDNLEAVIKTVKGLGYVVKDPQS
jgi:DNA-binding response OmpR family regulator